MIRKRVRGFRIGNQGDIKSWKHSLQGVPAFIIGNSPSLLDSNISLLKNYFTIGINRAFYQIDPTILIWQDAELYWNHRVELSRLKCIKFCRDISDPKSRFYHFKLTAGGYFLPEKPNVLHGRGSTGPLAFQLAYILGCDPIVLLGMDCMYRDKKTDFYGVNPSHKPHTLKNCSKGLYWIAKAIKHSGGTVISCSKNEHFEDTKTLEETLEILKPASFDRGYFNKKLIGRVQV